MTGHQSLAADDPRHGTANGYKNRGCRCARCRTAHAEYCRAANHRAGRCRPWTAYLAEISSVRDDTLRCGHCQEWKPDDAFPRGASKSSRRGRHGWCLTCYSEYQRERRSRLTEAERDQLRAYHRDWKRRARSVAE